MQRWALVPASAPINESTNHEPFNDEGKQQGTLYAVEASQTF